MNLDELQSVRDRERQTDKLQQLRESFYEDAGEFIQQLEAERQRVADRADDPFDAPEVQRLSDEINTAEQTVEAIYEKRVGKLVKAASFAAAELPAEVDGMTAEEQELFDQLVGNIKTNRKHVEDVLAGREPTSTADAGQSREPAQAQSQQLGEQHEEIPPEPAPGDQSTSEQSTGTDGDRRVSAADAMGGDTGDERNSRPPTSPEPAGESGHRQSQSGPGDTHGDKPVRKDGGTAETQDKTGTQQETSHDVSRQTVRIKNDVDTFVGYDERDYDLGKHDVVTLPATNADILVERGVAEQLE